MRCRGECALFGRTFDGVMAWGLIFLLEPGAQVKLIHKVAAALKPGGRFLFTSPQRVCKWADCITGHTSISLGSDGYRFRNMTYRCATCGNSHEGLPDMGFRWPEPCFGVPEAERDSRIKATSDTCSIDDEAFFIRGIILIPIKGRDDHFGLGVWVSQSRYLGAEDDGSLSGQQSAPSD